MTDVLETMSGRFSDGPLRRLGAALGAPAPTARAVRRKSEHVLRRPPRAARRLVASPARYRADPPVLVNSFPKSGTHLLWQVARGLPNTRDYGAFIASVPPIRHAPRSASAIERRLGAIVPGELLRAHLWHGEVARTLLERKNALHLFVYRDPRDVVVSEAHYIVEMTPWHALHPLFSAAPDLESRIALSIVGDESRAPRLWYPNIARRFEAYEGWLREPDVVSVRFEDLVEARDEICEQVLSAYAERAGKRVDTPSFLTRVAEAVDPARSPTYREGRTGRWRDVFTDEHREAMKRVAGELLVRLGYEQDTTW